MAQPTRTASERRRDTLRLLETRNQLWIATSSAEDPAPYLIPVSFAWTGAAFIVATSTASPTAVNLLSSGIARLAVGATDDVVLVDARLESAIPVRDSPAELADRYASQSDWDPRTGTELPSHYFVLTPQRIQAWRLASELPGRTIMRDARWVAEA